MISYSYAEANHHLNFIFPSKPYSLMRENWGDNESMSDIDSEIGDLDCLLIVHSGEISIKSNKVRRKMLQRLKQNLLNAMTIFNEVVDKAGQDWPRITDQTVHQHEGRLYINYSFPQLLGRWITKIVTGIAYCAPSVMVATDVPILTARVVELARKILLPNQSFALRVRREGTHKFTSQELASHLGAAIQREITPKPRVDLTNPDVEIFLDVRGSKTFVYFEKFKGEGGLPQGTQGIIMAELLPHPNEIMAALSMLRRGVAIHPVIFDVGEDVAFMELTFPKIEKVKQSSSTSSSPRTFFEITMSPLTRLLLANHACGYDRCTIVHLEKALSTIFSDERPDQSEMGCAICLITRKHVFQQLLETDEDDFRSEIASASLTSEGGLVIGLSFDEEGLKIAPPVLPLIQQLFDKKEFALFLPLLTLKRDEIGILDFPSIEKQSCCPFQREFTLSPNHLRRLLNDKMKFVMREVIPEIIIEEKNTKSLLMVKS